MFRKRRRNNASKETIIEDLSQHLVPIYSKQPCAFLIHNLLSSNECADLIKFAEETGFDNATVEGNEGKQIIRRDIRSCGRCIVDDVKLADSIFGKVMNAVRSTQSIEEKVTHAPWVSSSKAVTQNNDSEEEDEITAVGLNERLRFMKYNKGHFFAPHEDIAFTRGPEFGERAGEKSHITVMIYLNEKFKGGTTRFVCGSRYYDVKPRKGSALVFDHNLLHAASLVTKGFKYSLRTDIMYKEAPKGIFASTVEHGTKDAPQESALEESNRNDLNGILQTRVSNK